MEERDGMSEIGARKLAGAIEQHWHAQGYHGIKTFYDVRKVEIDPATGKEKKLWFVRSNIGPTGFPPKIDRLESA